MKLSGKHLTVTELYGQINYIDITEPQHDVKIDEKLCRDGI